MTLNKKTLGRDLSSKTNNKSVAKSAGIVSIAVMVSRVFGLIREQVFAYYFGAGFINDAYQVAFRIPNLLRDLFAEGALSVAFVKVFTDYQINKTDEQAWRLASMIYTLLGFIMALIVLLGILLAPYYVPILAWGFSPEKAQLSVTLTQIMFPFILLVALAALAMGILNTKGKFAIPASASTAFNIVSIISGLGFAYYLSGGSWEIYKDKAESSAQWAIIGMSIGTVIGGAFQLIIQIPSLIKAGFRFKFSLDFKDEGVKRVVKLMIPAVIGTSAIQVKVLVDTFVVSGIEGGVSWLPYAFRLMQFPIGVFGVAIGVAALPTLAKLGSQNDITNFRLTVTQSLSLVFFLTIPAACGLIILGDPIISLLYSHGGAFSASDVPMTSWALTGYAVGLAGYAAIKILSPSFYALEDAKTPMYVSLASILVHIFLSYSLMILFSKIGVSESRPNGYGHVGVALATSLVSLVNFLTLSLLLRRKIGGIGGKSLFYSLIKIIIASFSMSLACYFSYYTLSNYFVLESIVTKIIEVFVPIILGGVTFLLISIVLKINSLNALKSVLLRKN